jgi:hypothetical protein
MMTDEFLEHLHEGAPEAENPEHDRPGKDKPGKKEDGHGAREAA